MHETQHFKHNACLYPSLICIFYRTNYNSATEAILIELRTTYRCKSNLIFPILGDEDPTSEWTDASPNPEP